MDRQGSAVWEGTLKEGNGTVSTDSGALKDIAYSFNSRFENGPQSNPEELLGAAHAGCFSMALSAELGKAGFTPTRIDTTATVTLEAGDGGFNINKVHLDTTANVPGIDAAQFETIAQATKLGCPVSKLFKAEITLSAKLA